MTSPAVPGPQRTALAAIALHLRGDERGAAVLLRGADDLPAVAAELAKMAAGQLLGEDVDDPGTRAEVVAILGEYLRQSAA